MSLHRLLPKSAQNNKSKAIDALLELILVEWGWSYRDFQETPIPVIMTCLKEWQAIQKKRNKK